MKLFVKHTNANYAASEKSLKWGSGVTLAVGTTNLIEM